jgi:AhpD family alkylhydroperoxidase
MEPRMNNPAATVPGAYKAMRALAAAATAEGLPAATINLVHLRVSQINGCSFCAHMHARDARKAGETDERLDTVAAWRDTPFFTEAERAALALAEAVTRIADRPDPVTDEVFEQAAAHYDELALSALLLQIGVINTWNRLNIATRTVAGSYPV